MTVETVQAGLHERIGDWIDRVNAEPTNVGRSKAAYAEAVHSGILMASLQRGSDLLQKPFKEVIGSSVIGVPDAEQEITIGAGHSAAAVLDRDHNNQSALDVSHKGMKAPLATHMDVFVSLLEAEDPQTAKELREATQPLIA